MPQYVVLAPLREASNIGLPIRNGNPQLKGEAEEMTAGQHVRMLKISQPVLWVVSNTDHFDNIWMPYGVAA